MIVSAEIASDMEIGVRSEVWTWPDMSDMKC